MSRDAKRKRALKPLRSRKRHKDGSDPKAVRGEALKWKHVALPDRLEDAEGFYDLEEIEDVEVIRDERNHVMFRPTHKDQVKDAQESLSDGLLGEWDGFDDGNIAMQGPVPSPAPLRQQKAGVSRLAESATSTEQALSDLPYDLLSMEREGADVSAWYDIDLSQATLGALSRLQFAKPTPIQLAAIPPILEGKDVIGKAVTGSGKTLAFGIPIVEKFMDQEDGHATNPIALLLAPTRELAHQLERHLKDLCDGLENRPRIAKVTGGLSILKQQRQLEHADIIIGTPGRLWEVINDSHGLIDRLRKVQFLVVDEADRLLSEGHFKEVEDILELLDRKVVDDEATEVPLKSRRQTLVFSATFHKNLHQKLAGKLRSNSNLLSDQESLAYLLQKLPFRSKPVFVDSNPTSKMAVHLNESIVECGAMEKDLYLYATLLQYPRLKTLVFSNSISSVKRITPMLQNLEQSAFALHSSMPQKSRLRSLERFAASTSQDRGILVASDVAARGLDIPAVDLIIHYHVPHAADMYVHRSGRTARADKSGRSILLCSPEELVPTSRLIAKVHSEGKTPDVVSVDRETVTRIRPRVALAQKIVEAEQAKDKTKGRDTWLRNAAEELGVDYDSEEFEEEGKKHNRGRGGGKAKRLQEKAAVGREDVRGWREELKALLSKKVNLGVSAKYLAGGRVDVDAILDGKSDGMFLETRFDE